jgi:hypothetical protein
MTYTRPNHVQFLEEEFEAMAAEFQKKVDTQATFLLQEKGEIFVAQFIVFRENGEMLLKFPNTRSLPRKGAYMYCFTVSKELRNYRNWGNRTYGDLLKHQNNYSERIVCIWQEPYKDVFGNVDDRFSTVAFCGVDVEFAQNIAPWQFVDEKAAKRNLPANTAAAATMRKDGIILLLGPNKPPLEYLANTVHMSSNVSPFLPFCLF